MSHDEALKATVSKSEAKREIARHDCEGWAAFVSDVGDREAYSGREVLEWLGY